MKPAPTLGFHCHGMVDFEATIVANNLKHGEFYNLPPSEVPLLKDNIKQYGLLEQGENA